MNKNVIICIVIIILMIPLIGCSKSKPAVFVNSDNVTSDEVILNSFVTDKNTKEPIENAAVYLGGYWKCYTDKYGKCSIKINVSGAYGISAFKKEYNHSGNVTVLKIGENNFSIELEKKPEIPESVSIEGKIIENVTLKGTKSENHIFTIRNDNGEEYYIFNEIGQNNGFGLVNKRVRIIGFKDLGNVGWQRHEVEGICVENIEKIS